MNTQITLASKSQTRSRLLTNAKIKFKTVDHGVDEDEIKLSMSESSPEEIVTKLAETKALKASISNDGLVIGSDQGLDLNGKLINKAKNFDEAHEQLKSMSGKEHTLITTTVVAKENNITMVQLAQAFVNSRPFVTSNIIGATTMEQLKENIDSINIKLTEEMLEKINIIHNNNPNPAP